ncbi:hypothetical protein JCM11641_001715 [Rhodosporidiobolus odoratus]
MDAPAHRAEYILRHVEEFLGRIEVIASRSLAGGNRNFANYETIIRQGIQVVGYKESAMPTPRQAHELAEEFDRVVRNARDQRWAAVQDLPLPNNLAYFETFFNLMERQISRSAEKKAVAIPDPPFRWCGAESDNGMLQLAEADERRRIHPQPPHIRVHLSLNIRDPPATRGAADIKRENSDEDQPGPVYHRPIASLAHTHHRLGIRQAALYGMDRRNFSGMS